MSTDSYGNVSIELSRSQRRELRNLIRRLEGKPSTREESSLLEEKTKLAIELVREVLSNSYITEKDHVEEASRGQPHLRTTVRLTEEIKRLEAIEASLKLARENFLSLLPELQSKYSGILDPNWTSEDACSLFGRLEVTASTLALDYWQYRKGYAVKALQDLGDIWIYQLGYPVSDGVTRELTDFVSFARIALDRPKDKSLGVKKLIERTVLPYLHEKRCLPKRV